MGSEVLGRKSSIGFLSQLFFNGASRLVYLALLAHLALTAPENAASQVEYLSLALAVGSILSIQAFSYAQSIERQDELNLLGALHYQKLLIYRLSIFGICATVLTSTLGITQPSLLLPTIVSAALFSLNEIAFAINTIKNKASRAAIYYGIHLGFYGNYLLLTKFTQLTPEHIGLLISSMGIALLGLHLKSATKGHSSDRENFIASLKPRSTILVANLPTILFQPAIIYILHNRTDSQNTTNGAEFLVLLSISGMIAFGFGNYFQYYGRNQLEKRILKTQQQTRGALTIELLCLVIGCSLLAIPATLIYASLKNASLSTPPTYQSIIAIGMYAASVVRSQWFAAMCIRIGKLRYISHSNIIFLITATSAAFVIPEKATYILLLASATKFAYIEWATTRLQCQREQH